MSLPEQKNLVNLVMENEASAKMRTASAPFPRDRSESSGAFRDDGILVLIARRAAAEQPKDFGAGIPKLMLFAGRYRDGVAWFDVAQFAFYAHSAGAVRDVIDLLGFWMIMLLRACADRQARLGEALIANRGIAMRQQFANFRSVLRDECRYFGEVLDVHSEALMICSRGASVAGQYSSSNSKAREDARPTH
jgi:hypothetical protein